MKYVLGIDFGGGASKATLLDETGKIAATSTKEYPTVCVGSDGREQDPGDWLSATVFNIENVLKTSGVSGLDVEAVSFDAATHTAVLMDENFRVLRRSVYWTDTRCVREKEFLKNRYGSDIFEKFKHEIDTVWTLPELLWVKNNEPEIWQKVKKITFAKDFVRHYFTGDHVTDYIEAQGSLFFDFDRHEWSAEYLELLGIEKSYLPRVVSPDTVVSAILPDVAARLGLNPETKIVCGSTDTALEVFAAGAVKKGQTTIKLATAGRICVVSDHLTPDLNMINYSHLVKGLYYPGTATKSCAASLRWFRDTFGGEYRALDEAAEKIAVGADGLLFHPYLSGELTPCADPLLRGSFLGISGAHTKAHFVRAVLEGVALSMRDCKEYLESKGVTLHSAFLLGGGAKSRLWAQILSDCLGIELILTEQNDSSFGSAMLAGIAAGFFRDEQDALSRCSHITGRITPRRENRAAYDRLFEKYKRIQKMLTTVYHA